MKQIKNDTSLRESIIKTIATIARINEKNIDDSVLIREELGIDSIMSLEIVAQIERHYGIVVDEEETLQIKTVGEFIDYVQSKIINRCHEA
ncbi:MAG TPA: acyl carrier protein [Spirochaetota bacterium]|nr:acyl carrier protein [Spirochaetota bacterium]HPC39301.1 acyl carrier protein [Spirochaetota bacterium]HPL16844.1 acyl carrier protein [Spirochaetota bacterium]HQF08761.1 acyl carrier protein [Spirochaetota bacterium]HQH97538.1 acyl carrier protein [Spirochaetota bacterium]